MSRIIVDAIRNSSASSDSINLDSNARVGIGTSSPDDVLAVRGSNGGGIRVSDSTANMLIGTGSGPVGRLFTITNHGLIFGTNDTERMRITDAGNVEIDSFNSPSTRTLSFRTGYAANANGGMGLAAKDHSGAAADGLGIYGTDGVSIHTANAGTVYERLKIDTSGDIRVGRVYSNVTSGGANVRVQSDGLMQRDTSSRRYKNSIADATHGLADLNKLRPVTYKGNNDGDTVFGGLIAEEVHDAGLTEFVDYNSDNEPDALRYGNMVSLCIKAIQQLSAKVDTLETKVAALEAG